MCFHQYPLHDVQQFSLLIEHYMGSILIANRLFSYFVMKSILKGKRSVSDVYNFVYCKVKSTSNGLGDLKRQEPTLYWPKILFSNFVSFLE